MNKNGPGVRVYSGRTFHPLEPRPSDFNVYDIAHALGSICRFNGHSRHFYSVAEHSVILSNLVPPDLARWALMHDAAEAYVGDMVRPLKQIMPVFISMEKAVLQAIATVFGLPWPMPPEIRRADLILLALEARPMMGADPAEWDLPTENLPEVEFRLLPPREASRAFLDRFHELWPERRPPEKGEGLEGAETAS